MLNLYVTSTSHKDGKTFISSGLAATMQSLGYKTGVYKPIQTGGIEVNGFMQSPDLTYIKTVDPYINTAFTYLFKSKSEPLIVSEEENEVITIENILNDYKKFCNTSDCIVLDGDCGILSPIAPNLQIADMIKYLQTPLLFVITPNENSVNDALLSIYAAQQKGLAIRGVILNNIEESTPKKLLTSITRIIEEYTNVKILGLLPNMGKNPKPEDIITGILNGIDIESVFNVKIEKLDL